LVQRPYKNPSIEYSQSHNGYYARLVLATAKQHTGNLSKGENLSSLPQVFTKQVCPIKRGSQGIPLQSFSAEKSPNLEILVQERLVQQRLSQEKLVQQSLESDVSEMTKTSGNMTGISQYQRKKYD
jgi:hypothetical protein